jgi:hypothetical protein
MFSWLTKVDFELCQKRFPVIAIVGLLLVLLIRAVKADEESSSPCRNASACNPSNTTEAEEEEAKEYTLDLRIIHLFVVLVSSCIGLSIPVYGLRAIGDVLFMLRSFCAGEQFLPTMLTYTREAAQYAVEELLLCSAEEAAIGWH